MLAQFLIATPQSKKSPIFQSIVYLCQHKHLSGGLGVVINKPMKDLHLSGLLDHMGMNCADDHTNNIMQGGPTHSERGLIIYQENTQITKKTDVGLSYSKDFLRSIADGNGPDHFFLALGHTNWQAGQLESELQEHQWLLYSTASKSTRDALLFFTPIHKRYHFACELLGFQSQQLSWQSGHA